MGYYTRYELTILDPNTGNQIEAHVLKGLDIYPALEADIQKLDYGNGFFFDMGTNSFRMEEQSKWYDSEDEMTALSIKYPTLLFMLEGEGEEALDVWKEYFLNGRNQHCEAIITYEPLDLSLLKGDV
jgi:hypothetical protein